MKKALKRSLSFILAFTIIFNSAYSGLSEFDFSKLDFTRLFETKANAASEEYLSFSISIATRSYSVKAKDKSIEGDIVIPDSYNGKPVTSIASSGFSGCDGITSVTIPNSITSIGYHAFGGCTNLTSVTIPDSVTSIDSSSFSNCTSLPSISIPGSVTSIGDYAFEMCENLTSVIIGDGVTSIGDFAFWMCYSLESVIIPDSVTSIGGYAFEMCESLTALTLGNGIISIGDCAFSSCWNLTSPIIIPDSTTSIGYYAFDSCGIESVTIGNSVTSIGDYAFSSCGNLTTVTIPDNVTDIGEYAFYNCPNITYVTIGNGITSIGEYAFGYDYVNKAPTKIDGFTICGVEGTAAEQYAIDNEFTFKKIEGSHKHVADDWIIDAEPTCMKDGSRHKECSVCGITFETETIFARGHIQSGWIIIVEPTCTKAGSKHVTCTTCNAILYTSSIAALGHTSSDWIVDSELSCTVGGSKHKECTVCGSLLATETTDATGHTPSDWYIGSDATCTTEGTKHIKCTACNNILESETIPMLSHDIDCDFICTICGQRIYGVTRAYTISVCDIETGKPIEGATVTLGSNTVITSSTGAATFQISSNDATTLKIVADTYPETNESAYVPISQSNHRIYLKSEESGIYGAWCNGDNVINGDSQINARTPTLVADIVINGRAKANIIKYALVQDSTIIATSKDGHFEVKNTSFKVGKAVYVWMYTNGKIGHNLFMRKLNIKVVGYTLNLEANLKGLLPFSTGLTVTIPESGGKFGGMKMTFPNPFAKSSKITYHHQNDKIIVSMGFEHDFNDNGKDEKPKDLIKEMVNEWVEQKKDKGTREAHASFAIVVEFDESGPTDVYGQINVGFELEFPAGKTFWIGIVPVRADIVLAVNGELEVTKIKYDKNLGRLYSEYEFPLKGSISVYAGIGGRNLSGGVYGQAGIELVFSSNQQSDFEKLRLYGELGLYYKYRTWKGKTKTETIPLWYGQKIWPDHKTFIAARLYSRDGYEIDPRDYLENRTEWLNASLMSRNSKTVLLQDSTYTAIEPQIVTCGDTIMMLFVDDDGSEGINYECLYYSIYDKSSGGWSEPQKLDDNNCSEVEFDVYSDDSSIYVSYTEVDPIAEEDQENDEKILSTAEVIVAEYDFSAGKFINHTNISNNDSFDSLPTISETADGIVVSWVNNITNDPFSQNANNVIYYSSLDGQEWSKAETLTERGATIVSMDVGSIDGKSYIAIIRDIDCDLSTFEDRVLYTLDLDGNITEIVNEANTNDNAQFVEMNGNKQLIWYNNQNLYYIDSVSDTPSAMFNAAVSGLPANYKFTQIDSDSYAITFIQNEMREDEDGNVLNSSSIYGAFYNNGVWGNPVPVVLNEPGYYVDSYDVCMSDGKMLIPYIIADVTITDTTVSKTNTFLSTTFEPRNDISAGAAEFLPSELFEGNTIEIQVPVTNNAWQSIDSISYEIKNSQGNAIYTGTWEQIIESGATEYLSVVLPKSLLSEGENYIIHIDSTDLIDINMSNNVSELLFWYTDFSITADKVVSEENQEIQYTIINEGNISGNATLKVYKLADDGTEIILAEKEISNLGIGESLSDSLTVTQDYYDEDSDTGTIYLSVVPEKEELYDFNDSVSLTVGDIEYNETTDGDSSAVVIENPVISEPYIEYDKVNSNDISVQVTENGCSFVGINELSEENYTYSDGTLTIDGEYLSTLDKGYHYFTLTYSNSGITTDIVLIVEITDTSYESITITAENQEAKYDGFALELGKDIVYSTESKGAVSSEYSVDNGTTWIAGLPTKIGEYLVRLTVAQDDENRYASASHTFTVTIKKGTRAISVPMITGTDNLQVLFGNSVPTAGKSDGTILYGYSLTNDVSTVTEWSETGILPVAQTPTTYYVFAKIVNSEKYENAYSIGFAIQAHVHEYTSTIVPPSVENEGFTVHTCTGCGDEYKDNYVDKIELVYGDCNGDGFVTTEDLERLRLYFANKDPLTGVSTTIVNLGADCNGDGNITMVDLSMLRKYLETLNPVTGESIVVLGPR